MCIQDHSVENSTYRFKISDLFISLNWFSGQQKALDYKAPPSEQWPSAEPVWACCLPLSRLAALDGEQLLSSALIGTCLSSDLLAVSADPFHQFQFSLGYFPISTEIYFQTPRFIGQEEILSLLNRLSLCHGRVPRLLRKEGSVSLYSHVTPLFLTFNFF